MNTSTTYLKLMLAHPFVAGASPLTAHLDGVRRLEDAGAAAIVLHSLFEEQITMAASGKIRNRDPVDPEFAEMLAPFPAAQDYPYGPDEYLEYVRTVRTAVRIPVIGSLNGTTPEAWLKYARLIETAGADALELNCYEVITDPKISSESVESEIERMVRELKNTLRIPIAVKLSPFFTAFSNVATRLEAAGADGLVIFNRFYQPDIDIRQMRPTLNLELSRAPELLLRLRWLAILYGRVRCSLAVTGGVETTNDGVKSLLAGAHVVQMASALLRHGPGFVKTMVDGLTRWMEWQRVQTIDDIRGRVSLQHSPDPELFERANYIRMLHQWNV